MTVFQMSSYKTQAQILLNTDVKVTKEYTLITKYCFINVVEAG